MVWPVPSHGTKDSPSFRSTSSASASHEWPADSRSFRIVKTLQSGWAYRRPYQATAERIPALPAFLTYYIERLRRVGVHTLLEHVPPPQHPTLPARPKGRLRATRQGSAVELDSA